MYEEGAFQDKGLTSIIIPDTVTYIGEDTFYSSPANYGCTSYDEFGGNNIDHITIPESVEAISNFNVSSMNSITLPDTVTKITNVYLPSNTVIPCTDSHMSVGSSIIKYNRTCSVGESGGDDSYY